MEKPVRPRRQKQNQSSSTGPGLVARPSNPYSIEVLSRAIDVLSVFTHARPAMSLAEIV